MKLVALNERWAVFIKGGCERVFDPFEALKDLIKIKSYKQLLNFLIKHAGNTIFLVNSDDIFGESFKKTFSDSQRSRYLAPPIVLTGNLNKILDEYSEVDYLDVLTVEDLGDVETYEIRLNDLIYFRDSITKILTIAAMSLGSDLNMDLFKELNSEEIYGKDWCNGYMPCKVKQLRSFYLSNVNCAIEHHGFINDESIESYGIFSHLDNFSKYQLASDPKGNVVNVSELSDIGAYSNLYPLSTDGVIYTHHELYDEKTDESDFGTVVTIYPGSSVKQALRLLCGRTIEYVLNFGIDTLDGYPFLMPRYDDEDFDEFRFELGKGFKPNRKKLEDFWFWTLFDEAKRLIVENKVSLCPVCGAPVLIKDLRGRKSKEMCSDSCKTTASKNRREHTLDLAKSGVPIEEALGIIGEEYESSVKKWYGQAIASSN